MCGEYDDRRIKMLSIIKEFKRAKLDLLKIIRDMGRDEPDFKEAANPWVRSPFKDIVK